MDDQEQHEQYEPSQFDDEDFSDQDVDPNFPSPFSPSLHPNGDTGFLGHDNGPTSSKARKKARNPGDAEHSDHLVRTPAFEQPHPSYPHQPHGHPQGKDRIWNTSTAEERERIKQFWLSLKEHERRSLVKVEKDAVLKKMKDQQKHSCSCTVCGRKRTAIEEELEVLYDAYYDELENYANRQALPIAADGSFAPINPRLYHHPMSRTASQRPLHAQHSQLSKGRVQEIEDDLDELGDDEEESDGIDDDPIRNGFLDSEQANNPAAADFFNFGNSLTVQGEREMLSFSMKSGD